MLTNIANHNDILSLVYTNASLWSSIDFNTSNSYENVHGCDRKNPRAAYTGLGALYCISKLPPQEQIDLILEFRH
jgi:hypothetical protein